MRRPILLTLALVLTTTALLTGQSAELGRIIGHVKLAAKIPGKPLAAVAYPRRSIGNHEGPSIPEIRNVVVYVGNAAPHGPLTPKRAELRQEHETFVPHVLAVTVGSTITFPNGDPFFHNVF